MSDIRPTDADLTELKIERRDDGVAILRIDRPERMNAQTIRMFTEFGLAARILADDGTRALVLTASGTRAFSAGFDLGEIGAITEMGPRSFLKFQETATQGFQAIRHLPFPVIAAVHGAAVGGGMALALAADLRLVSPETRFSAAFIKMGLSIGELGTSYNLTRLVGPGKTAEFGYTGRMIGAEEAVATGLANRIVPTESLLDEALAMASAIASRDPAEVRVQKTTLQRALELPSFAAAMDVERTAHALLLAASGGAA
jgi:enoyl-CoA hydratase/carnithine racemase